MSDSLFVRYLSHVRDALRRIVPDLPEEVAARVELTPTRDPAHGDMATNAALLAAKPARRRPAEIAAELAAALVEVPGIAKAEPAGPGFVNLTLDESVLRAVVGDVLRAGESYGDATLGQGVRANVEYVSANPTGPMHVGHCRGAVVGDALANLLAKAGYAVTKEYYINDAGAQVIALAWAAYWRYLEAIGTTMDREAFAALVPGGIQYGGDYLVPVGQALAELHGTGLAGPDGQPAAAELWMDTVKPFVVDAMMAMIREDLDALGVRHDVFTSEAAILAGGVTDGAIARLDAQGLLYEGVLEPPKGKLPDDWEARPQTLFRSTAFGDDVDRPLRKSDGSNTYFANDIGYHDDKVRRGADQLIDVWGADHGGYVTRMKAAVQALAVGGKAVGFDVLLCQIVRIVRDGQPVRMSKRAGTFVTLRDLIDEVGRDAVRFTMLTRKADAQMEFDLDQVVAQTRDNPVFYVQYAHARCRSVLRAAQEMLGEAAIAPVALVEADLDGIGSDAELALLRRIAQWPRTVEGAAQAHEPHRIAFYLGELAGDFHTLWNRGRDDATLRFLQEDDPVATRAKLAMVEATATVIRSGLAVLGVEPVEEMR
ncbi:arginine--tRNA ligase [Gluconacetobacter liquefaciens]|uniref:Arginine--tRNA ligase n=1 Tax=Gluconacetobacter liquefaciens TaxID=89584 RepID=A0A370GA26_GLULI|nr:arginine--tRNA ligase [Gluconacetobacter liquefaciens]MBB2186285.1 arginine--tRNA ligase [Gluconacetobacter liquefaciens]RDI38823.1 arginyl-tRNA synthetase [Gluconacetobacter liquefaciens]GBR03296.1 arginyl-tRNA synthetase [Gluconacetobacter liquefaciens NRIC 0522]GEB36462.1 arginine--tRNA ligase [Gluconacetobacter liquefaciens]